ncbi:MAG: hypothetical protein MET45_20900 [Nostoc sp. LLA-1]|uniref:hypothetical protein n=1 Tax=Nostoc sp. CCY0012 TaxID=1056123 RepID=UPI002A0320DB|nr:hypothetical protein [Cyanocohniella sp. LLY]
MSKILKSSLTLCLTALILSSLYQRPASANPFRFLQDINNTIRTIDSTVKTTNTSIQNLSNTLGIQSPGTNSKDPTQQLLGVYETWYKGLSSSDQEIVAWLVMQHAKSQTVTFETISNSEWFLQKPITDQSQVSSLFFKLQQVIDASAHERSRFLSFAFCVNSGGNNCGS